jgi:hypothetical protein
MRKLIAGAAVALSIVAGSIVGLASPAAAATPYSNCDPGWVCFYTEQNGGGSMCTWPGNDHDWKTGDDIRSWATTKNVKSVANRGLSETYTGVAYYADPDYITRMGCTPRGGSGNLKGTYKLRSHLWVTGRCAN